MANPKLEVLHTPRESTLIIFFILIDDSYLLMILFTIQGEKVKIHNRKQVFQEKYSIEEWGKEWGKQ